MKLSDLTEGFNLDSSIKSIISDIGTPVTNTYDALRNSAINYMHKNGSLDRWGFIAGSVESRNWWDTIWSPATRASRNTNGQAQAGLQGQLYDLTRQVGQNGAELSALLSRMITDRRRFTSLASELPPILARIGKKIGSDALYARAVKWQREHAEYEAWLREFSGADEVSVTRRRNKKEEPEMVQEPPKPKLPSAIPAQNAAAENVVNAVLRNLPNGVAGDIRQAIAKSHNKIAALQAELVKRGIAL